jgi:hypothetical protein
MTVFRFVHSLRKMKNSSQFVVPKEVAAFQDRGSIRGTGPAFSIILAAEGTFHPGPVGYNDLFGINPLIIFISVLRTVLSGLPLLFPPLDFFCMTCLRSTFSISTLQDFYPKPRSNARHKELSRLW